MRKIKIATILFTLLLLNTNLLADGYLGVKYGNLSTNKTVYGGLDDKENSFIAYDNVNLLGLDFSSLQKEELFVWGVDLDLLFNNGKFIDGGKVNLDLKFGAHYSNVSAYGIIGGGIQSLSDYTVAAGSLYGIGINYDVFTYLALKAEYTTNSLSTTDNDESTAGQKYTLSGISAAILFRF